MKIDLQLFKPAIVRSGGPEGVCYIEGTNKWIEWAHHFIPGARRREIRWGREVSALIDDHPEIHTIAGHSVGGTVACVVHTRMSMRGGKLLRLFTYGAKRVPSLFHLSGGTHYRIKRDWVPLLPPWRPALPCAVLDYGKISFREAHGPRLYFEQMIKDGVR